MRLVNEQFETISRESIDLSKGTIVKTTAIKEDATPIDNVKKFAWFDEDWEEVEMFLLNKEQNTAPTELDRLQAQVSYTAMMTDTLIGG